MKKTLGILAGLSLLAMAGAASAQVVDDPLHGMICTGAGTGCSNAADNGNFTPLPNGQIINWGFSISPGPATGNLDLVFLVPTNTINVNTFNLPNVTDNGGGPLSASVFSRTNLFTSATGGNGQGGIGGYLGAGAFSPTDNFDNAKAGETALINPGFGGSFLAFTLNLNNISLNDVGSTNLPNDFSFGSNLPAGTVIIGLFTELTGKDGSPCDKNCLIGTAASADLVVTSLAAVPAPIVGAGLPGLMFAIGGLLALNRRRKFNQGLHLPA
jgi:hypothetical protein